jgi:hypothetical protein
MKTKTFDCVETMHRGAEEVRKETENMSFEEQVNFWREQSELLKQMQEEVKDVSKRINPGQEDDP